MACILFTDPGLHPKKVDYEPSEASFFEVVLREGGRYTTADCFETRQQAWRPLTGQWRQGSFSQELRLACLILGFDPGNFNVGPVRERYDDGASMEEVALQLIHRDKSTIRPISGSLIPSSKQYVK